MKKIILSFLLVSLLSIGFSQDTSNNWKLYPNRSDSTLPADTVYGVVKSHRPGSVTIEKDSRIDKVSEEMRGGITNKPLINGYRIQVLSSSTKSRVDGEKGRFMTNYRDHKSYIDYKAPNFRLRVGNFRTKLDAQKFQHEIKKTFPNTLVINDLIDLPRLN